MCDEQRACPTVIEHVVDAGRDYADDDVRVKSGKRGC
jgi:hypothetical protein